jgi:hypothetical protein
MGRLKSMETGGLLKATQKSLLPEFCKAMSAVMTILTCQQWTANKIAVILLLSFVSGFAEALNPGYARFFSAEG